MKREEYLAELKLKLEENDFGPVEEAISYFNDLLQDRMSDEGVDEETAVASLEAPSYVAGKLKENEDKARTAPVREETEDPDSSGIRTINAKADLVRRIIVRDRNTLLTVLGEDRQDILIRHPEHRKARYDFTLENGTLSLIREELHLSFQLFVFDIDLLPREMRELEIRVPRELAAEMDLRTSNSRLNLDNISCWGKVEAATSNSRLTATRLGAKSLALKSSNASMELKEVKAQQGIAATTSNGKITAEGVCAPSLRLKTSNGAITLQDIASVDITLQTSNGSIKGELPGQMSDYAISSGTSNGKNSLPPVGTGDPKRLSAHTSNARINLGFTGE